MKLRKLTLILSGIIGLAGCNGGGDNSQQSATNQPKPNSQQLVQNPRILRVAKSVTLKSGSFDQSFADNLAINDGVRVGYGYDPQSGNVIVVNDFDDSQMYYTDSSGKQISGFAGISQSNRTINCVSGAYGTEIGNASSYSSANLYKADFSGSTGVGLGKVSAALSASYADSFASAGQHYDRVFGTKRSCALNSLAAPEINPTTLNYQQAAMAIRMASNDINSAISEIEKATDPTIRKQLINEFYQNHGTYMVSSVRLGAIAAKNIHLAENQSNGSTNMSSSASVSYSSPFSEGSGSVHMERATTFSGDDWNYSIAEGQYPSNDTSEALMRTINNLEGDLSGMKSSGLIRLYGLTSPSTASVDQNASLPKPMAPDYINQGAQSDYKAAKDALSNLNTAMHSIIEDTTGDKSVRIVHYNTNATNIKAAITQAQLLQNGGENTGKPLLNFLQAKDIADFDQKTLPIINVWLETNQADLYSTAVAELDKDKDITAIEAQIQKNIEAKNSAIAAANNQQTATQQAIESATETRKSLGGITFSQFLLKQMQIKNPQTYSDYLQYLSSGKTDYAEETFNYWLENLAKNNPEELEQWMSSWQTAGGNVSTLQSVPRYVSEVDAKAYKAKSTLKDDPSNTDSIYSGYGVLDYSITPWAKIFPVLLQNVLINDSKEVGSSMIINTINKDFMRIATYLGYVQRLDPSLGQFYTSVRQAQATLQTLNDTLMDLASSQSNSSLSQQVTFNNKQYDLSNINNVIQLNLEVTAYINNTFNQFNNGTWYNITKELFNKGIISNYGSFAGLQPESPVKMDEYSIIDRNSSVTDPNIVPSGLLAESLDYVPRAAKMENATDSDQVNRSPLRVILQYISQKYFKSSELPAVGVLMGGRGTLLPSDPIMQNNFMTSSYNPADRLALKYASNDGKAYQLLGVMPLILSTTKSEGTEVTGLGLADSNGRIWGINASLSASGQQYASNTPTYTLDLSKTVSASSPAYTLTLNDGGDGLVSEFIWRASSNGTANDYAYKYFLGMSIDAPQLVPGSIDIQGDMPGSGTFWTHGSGQVVVANPKDQPDLIQTDFNYDGLTALSTYKSYITMNLPYTNTTKIMTGSDREQLRNWGDSYLKLGIKAVFSSIMQNSIAPGGVIKHQLVIKPISESDIQDMQNALNDNSKKTPLLPNYGF